MRSPAWATGARSSSSLSPIWGSAMPCGFCAGSPTPYCLLSTMMPILSGSTQRTVCLFCRPRDNRVRGAVPVVAAVHRRPFLFRLRDDRLPLRIQHEHPLRGLDEARAAADATLALDAHHDAALGKDSAVAGLGPFVGPVERGHGGAITLFDFFPQVVERKHGDVLDARL